MKENATTVLVAEDDVLLRMCVVMLLQDNGFTVIEAENADDALTILRSGTAVDAILTDIEMPGAIDGLQLAKIANAEFPNLGVVVVSGRVKPQTNELPPGARFFGKPITDRLVVEALRESTTESWDS